MDSIEQLLAVKTRLTTIRGYAQLIEREISRTRPPTDRLSLRVAELNREVLRLIDLVAEIEAGIRDATGRAAQPEGDDYISSSR